MKTNLEISPRAAVSTHEKPVPFDPAFANGHHAWPDHGGFDVNGDYVLTDPRTPRPWQNLLSNDDYLLSVTQLGTGFSAFRGAYYNRVTRSYSDSEFDDKRSGRFFYIRDAATGAFFSPTVFPVDSSMKAFTGYACRYSPGGMQWEGEREGVRFVLETLVCQDEPTELHRLTLINLTPTAREFDLFFYLEWAFTGPPEYHGFAITSGFDPDANALWADVKTHPRFRAHQTAFVTCSAPIRDFDGRRLAFEGPLGSIQHPEAVENGRCRNSAAPVIGTATGAVRAHVHLGPMETCTTVFAVSVVPELSAVPVRAAAVRELDFDGCRQAVADYWEGVAAAQRADVPDLAHPLRSYLARWLPCQIIQNARWSRWAAKKGYRDVLQDAAGTRLLEPDRARRMILEAIRHQRSDGHAPRCWDQAPWKDHQWIDARDSVYWLFYAIDAYLRETSDLALLEEAEPFIDSEESVTVWNHLERALDFLWTHRGAHGFSLIGEGDWNDSLNTAGIGGKGESIWLTQALAHGILLFEKMATATGRDGMVPGLRRRHAELAAILEKNAWDGEWYRQGTSDDGRLIGSKEAPEGGHIYLLPQAWAVISQTASEDRICRALNSVTEHLETPRGPLLLFPPYSGFQPQLGRISGGGSEVDSVYVHAAIFYAHALVLRGDADLAWDVIRRVLPASEIVPSGRSGAEPFTCINALTGESWAWPGWSYTGWWSGSPAWILQILVEGFLGAKAEYDGLRIAPCLPSEWSEASLTRRFRGASYEIHIRRQPGAQPTLCVDGRPLADNLLAPAAPGSTVRVECTIA